MIDRKRSVGALVVLLGWSMLAPSRMWAQSSTALSWRPWEQELISSIDYTASNGNPYRDLALAVQYWRMPAGATSCGAPVVGTSTSNYFAGYGFWEGGKKNSTGGWDTNNKRFLIRSTFSDGTWCWKTICQRSLPDASASSTPDCANDAGLNRSGQVTVTKAASPVRLYAVGLPQVAGDHRSLVYGDNATKFLWLGETAWDAPINYGNGAQWAGFVTDRTAPNKDFRTVLVAPATQTVSAIPTNGFKGFSTARTDCSAAEKAVVPNRCSIWDARYWEQFDDLVLTANSTRKGLMVIVAGVMDPLVRGGDNNNLNVQFPRVAESTVFARNLAARLAGHFVFFSPSYDTKTNLTPVNQSADGSSVTALIKAVGAAIKSAAPRHLIGVHLAGSNPLGDYLNFAGETWLDFQMFQSGHGGSNAGAPCNYSNDFERSVCRAREGSLEFLCIHQASTGYTPLAVCTNGNNADRIGNPKPAVDVEGEYESAYVKVTQPDGSTVLVRDLHELTPSRARSRHTAWTAAFSGSFGFNIGFYTDVTSWTNPAAYSNNYTEAGRTNLFQSDDDLGRMSMLLGQSPWSQYVPGHTLVCGNFPAKTTPDPCGTANTIQLEELKRHIGITDKVILVHVPGVSSSQQPVVRLLSQGLLTGLSCSNKVVTWVDPRGGGDSTPRDVAAKCTPVANGVQLSAPPASLSCSDGRSTCDWILKLQSKSLASGNAPNAPGTFTSLSSRPRAKLGSSDNDLQVWTEIDPDSQGTSVWAQLLDSNGDPIGDSFLVHPLDPRLRSLPTATRDSSGNFLVVWEEEGGNATDNVAAVQLSNDGAFLGDPFLLNGSTDDQNGDPAVTSDSGGFSYVTWTEYPLDGGGGDIWIQVFEPTRGMPTGDALLVTGDPGNQFGSQVQADGQGGVVVAWNSDPPPSDAALAKAKPATRQGVYFRKLRRDGRLWGPSHAVHGNGKGRDRLVDLKVKANGKIKIVWRTVNDEGEDEGMYEQDFDSAGNPESTPKRVGSGS